MHRQIYLSIIFIESVFNVYFSYVWLVLGHLFDHHDHMHQLIDRLQQDGLFVFVFCLVYLSYLCYAWRNSSYHHLCLCYKHIVVDCLLR